MEPTIESLIYVIGAQHFWLGMGMTISTGMLLGGLFFNGDFSQAKKGLIMMVSYISLLVMITIPRVMESYERAEIDLHSGRPFAGLVTIVLVSLAYFLGIFIGVAYLRWLKERKHGKQS